MAEFVRFVNNGASLITPAVVEKVIRKLPVWKAEFTQIDAPKYPHLVDQLEFLADAVEDCYEGVYKELPYFAMAEAVFALTYAQRQVDIIPDSIVDLGHADDSSVVRAVIMQNERAFEKYAKSQGISWQRITVKP
ncbi:MAG TPA: hypothetical protein DHV39_01215 [Verrucomicrobiales bacterium]|nr:hypothetical protein [Verrucomicrobiales bacterium]